MKRILALRLSVTPNQPRKGDRMKRFVLEGEWSGYQSYQRRVCHRTVERNPKPFDKLHSIRFTDGTTLDLSIRPCKPRERVKQIHGYDSLIRKCISQGVSSVEELYK